LKLHEKLALGAAVFIEAEAQGHYWGEKGEEGDHKERLEY